MSEPIEALSRATILHADLDAFYASVEQRDNPALRGKPVLVGGGVVLACSYEAKARGVRTAMTGHQARALCPDAIVVDPRMEAYSEASKRVFEIFKDTTPLVEGISIDEAFLDVGGLGRLVGDPTFIARQLRHRVRDEVGLAITVGVARTKFLAKVASGVGKPDGLLLVEPEHELEFLHPLPVDRLWGVGPVTAQKLRDRGIETVAQVAEIHSSTLVSILGPGPGRHIHSLAHNRDPRRVVTHRRRRSIGSQQALGRQRRSKREVEVILVSLVDRVARRLREGDRVARTVTLRFRYHDFERATRSFTLQQAGAADDEFLRTARQLLHDHWPTIADRGVSLIGFTLSNLDDADAVQMGLPFARPDNRVTDRRERDAVLDNVRNKFGNDALKPASILNTRHISVPTLPDPGRA